MQPAKPVNGLALASLICGIASLCLCACWTLSLVLGVLGVVFALTSRRKGESLSGLAIGGLICGAIGLVLGVCFLFLTLSDWEYALYEWAEEQVYDPDFWDYSALAGRLFGRK